MIISHYSDHPVALDRTRAYDQTLGNSHKSTFKPAGLWVSADGEDDWAEWCLREEFCPDGLACRHVVTLAPQATLLWLETPQALLDFHRTYAEEDEFDRLFARANPDLTGRLRDRDWRVNWVKVAEQYDGLMIAPYHWRLRMRGPMWFYAWDCASGCIWNLDAVESFTYAPLPALTAGPS